MSAECYGQQKDMFDICQASPEQEVIRLEGCQACGICVQANIDTLQELACTDALTELPNYLALSRKFEAMRDRNHPFGMVQVDIENFKYVNDSRGHEAGDVFLKFTARYLQNSLRKDEDVALIARRGGDEFVLLVDLTPRRNTRMLPKNRLARVRERIDSGFADLSLIHQYNNDVPEDRQAGFRSGAALYDPGMELDEILRLSDPKGSEATHNYDAPSSTDLTIEFMRDVLRRKYS